MSHRDSQDNREQVDQFLHMLRPSKLLTTVQVSSVIVACFLCQTRYSLCHLCILSRHDSDVDVVRRWRSVSSTLQSTHQTTYMICSGLQRPGNEHADYSHIHVYVLEYIQMLATYTLPLRTRAVHLILCMPSTRLTACKDTRRQVTARISRLHPSVSYLLVILQCLRLAVAVRRMPSWMLPDRGHWHVLCRSELMLAVAETAAVDVCERGRASPSGRQHFPHE